MRNDTLRDAFVRQRAAMNVRVKYREEFMGFSQYKRMTKEIAHYCVINVPPEVGQKFDDDYWSNMIIDAWVNGWFAGNKHPSLADDYAARKDRVL